MPDIPRDPRQLARDILAGKISIEELARERAKQQGVNRPPPTPQARMPQQIPLPRPVPPPQPQRPVIRQIPSGGGAPFPQRQPPRPPVVRIPAPARRALPVEPAQPQREARAQVVTPQAPAGPAAPQTTAEAFATLAKPAPPMEALAIHKVMRSRGALRQCIVMAEVLGKPVALREDW